jgi:hypothetical protein
MMNIFYDIKEINSIVFSHTSFGDLKAYENLWKY